MAALQLAKASYFILRIVVAFEDVKSRKSHDFSCGKAHARRLASLEVERVLGEGEKPRPDCTPGQLRAQEKSRGTRCPCAGIYRKVQYHRLGRRLPGSVRTNWEGG
jgi:hypothetical protein